MFEFKIITDSSCDLTAEMYRQLDVAVTPMGLEYDGVAYENGQLSPSEFYNGLRSGKKATTSAVNPEGWTKVIEPVLKNGQNALVMAFSSALSTTYQSAEIAAQELREAYPQRKILVVDTLCASMGQGLLVWYAAKQRAEGQTLEQVHQWVVDNRLNLAHWFTVDDLMYLKRGGRVSATTAVMGTMLNIKPVLHVDDEGRLISVGKARGRKASLNQLAQMLSKTGLPGANDTVFLSHGDCLQEAQQLAQHMKDTCGVKEVVINHIGEVIGSHSGPGTMALFFLAEKR